MAHTEAPASVTYSVTSPKGYSVLFTVRGDEGGKLLEEMDAIEEGLVDKGYTSNGKPVQKPLTKYNSSDSATQKQKDVLKDWDMWKEGMTKAEASELISKKLGK